MAGVPATLQDQLHTAGQEHLLQQWNQLTPDKQKELLADLQEFDWGFVNRVFKSSIAAAASTTSGSNPATSLMVATKAFATYASSMLRGCTKQQDGTAEERAAWRARGMHLIAQGKAAVLLLAGGQGTRLGSALPKGCYDIGLPSHKSLFQIQAERLLRLQQLAAQHAAQQGDASATKPLRWIIMTSPFTHADTVAHFKQHNFFGLLDSQVTFFQQGSLPCLTEQGKAIMSTPHSIAKAPDGNGGIYMSLQASGVLDMLVQEGVEALDCYCVDNALARLGDPLFLGYCHTRAAQVGARVVRKAHPEEKVGVFACRGSSTCVIEYSEMPPGQATAVDPATGSLLYQWSNICMHYFTTEWLREVCAYLAQGAAYHIARKAIPSKDGPMQGIKLELFIFDTFPTAQRVALMEVDRAAEFAPVKNAPGSANDSPDTARAALLALGASWVQAAGGAVIEAQPGQCTGVEVSPLVSYAGEGLEDLVAGKTVACPSDPLLQTRAVH